MRAKPIYLNLFTFAFPITAIVSILHRLSGMLLFILIPSLLMLLQNMMSYPELMLGAKISICTKILIWCGLTGLIYHFTAGIRHLIMDMGYGEFLKTARLSSYLVLVLTLFGSILVGIKLW